MSETIPGYDRWKLASPPYLDGYPDEPCDRCHRDLDDSAFKVKDPRYPGHWSYYCSDCCEAVERCDGCGFIRCTCPIEETVLDESAS